MVIGIDFGTSKSVVAVWSEGTSTTIPDLQGRTFMPSLVLVAPDEQLHIGWEALNHPLRYQSEYFTISSIKRMIGKAGETTWGQFRTYPQEVSALILGRLKMRNMSITLRHPSTTFSVFFPHSMELFSVC